ncbi:MAG TPA: zf-HC2 domain-containing protein [Candidatus Krumholzibacteria bacterium]
MNCRRARNLLFDFFDGASNETLRAEVERHLGECTDCEQFASEMTRSLALLKHVPVEPLDENFNWKVKLAIHRERNAALSRARSAGTWVRMWNVRYAISGGLAFSTVLVAGLIAVRSGVVTLPSMETLSGRQIAQNTAPSDAPSQAVTTTRRATPARTTNDLPLTTDAPHLVSFGAGTTGRNAGPVTGAIDKTVTEARIDSLVNSEVMKIPAHERERVIQRHIERLLQQLQSQQSAPAQP